MPDLRPIRLLPDDVINKIAAGEVVERPASVLKELMENALDAGASQIDVEVVEGGRKAVLVSDDGIGMSRDDALLSLERHATSKIRGIEDLDHVRTMGFRGEALAAIASVSRLTLTTRARGAESGTEILLSGGKALEVRDAGGPPGTQVAVRNLFFNVPARRKFLRSDQTEIHHLRQVFLCAALARPDVGMRLAVDGQEVHRLPPADLADRLRELFGRDLAAALRPVDSELDHVRVTGYAGLPQVHRPDRSEQYVFVNRRPASAPVLAFAIGEAYRDLIPRGRHSVLFLFLDLDPAAVDVNVHPTKREVRFRHTAAVRDAVIDGIRRALDRGAPAADPAAAARDLFLAAKARSVFNVPDERFQSPLPYPAPPVPRSSDAPTTTPPAFPPMAPGALPSPPIPAPPPTPSPPTELAAAGGSPWTWCRVMGRVGGCYLALETEDGLVLLDPQAAHQRVLYERLLAEMESRRVMSQGLLRPEAVELREDEISVLRQHAAALKDMGFGVSDFGGRTLLLDAAPAVLGDVSPAELLREVAAALARGAARPAKDWVGSQVAQAATAVAVRARQTLSPPEIERLIEDLAASNMPYTSPSGRPTMIFLSLRELHRKFGREV